MRSRSRYPGIASSRVSPPLATGPILVREMPRGMWDRAARGEQLTASIYCARQATASKFSSPSNTLFGGSANFPPAAGASRLTARLGTDRNYCPQHPSPWFVVSHLQLSGKRVHWCSCLGITRKSAVQQEPTLVP